MFKWGFIILGLFFVWGGIDNYLNYSDHVNENPEMVDAGKLKQLIDAEDKRYVSFSGSLDLNGRIFSTHLDYPAYSKYAPWDIQSINAVRGNLSKFIGAVVEVSLPVVGNYLELETMRVDEDNVKTASSIRLMAPLMGTNGKIWVFSPPFHSDKEAEQEWLSRAKFNGRMSKMENINRNYELRHELSDLRSTYAQGGGGSIPYNALVIDTYILGLSENAKNRTEYHVAVKDSDASVYVKTTKENEASIMANNIITGVLQPQESRYYSGFAGVLDLERLPRKIGIISMQSGSDVNEDNFFYTLTGVIGGLIFIALGGLIGRFQKRR